MLVIPIQAQPGAARAPLATIALIVINVLVFLLYQSGDGQIATRAAQTYHQAELLLLEQPLYEQYLAESSPVELAHMRLDAEVYGEEVWFASIFYDRGFDHYLENYWQQAPALPLESLSRWRAERAAFERERNRLSALAAGLIPAEAKPWTFIFSAFLHGDWGHLLGNMVFLVLFGVALERALGAGRYLAMYLVCGVAAGLLHSLFHSQSYVPLVGASGAISGLMGMYVALYRLRRIRFFYALFFYFGEFRAPALWILPLWLGKEIAGHIFSDTNVAYLAHAGGLLAGAGLMLLARRSHTAFAEAEQAGARQDALAAGMAKVRQAMNQLDYPRARALVRKLCEQHPSQCQPWRAAVEISRPQPRQPAFAEDVGNMLDRALAPETDFSAWAADVEEVLELYQKALPEAPLLTGARHLALAQRYWQLAQYEPAERHLRLARATVAEQLEYKTFVERCASFYTERGQQHSARRMLALAAPAAAGSVASVATLPRELLD